MTNEQNTQEALLSAWMQMSVCIRGNRILSQLSFNEIMLCGILYRQQEAALPPLTATELGDATKLLKSQINHILTNMEKNGIVRRERGTVDKRVIHVHLTEHGRELYAKEHAHVMEIMSFVHSNLGNEDTHRLTQLIIKATALVTTYSER